MPKVQPVNFGNSEEGKKGESERGMTEYGKGVTRIETRLVRKEEGLEIDIGGTKLRVSGGGLLAQARVQRLQTDPARGAPGPLRGLPPEGSVRYRPAGFLSE